MIDRLINFFAPYEHADLWHAGKGRRLWFRLDRYDKVSLALIAVILLAFLANIRSFRPAMSDTWYHLALAQKVVQRGHIPLWADWEYAPTGRPNLYPPLLHLLLAGLSVFTGGSVIKAGHLCAALFPPAAFLTCWYGTRWLFNSRVALMAVLVLGLDLFHIIVTNAYIPSTVVNVLMPALLVTFLARRVWLSVGLLTLMMYSHIGFPTAVALGLLLFGVKYVRYRRQAFVVVGASYLAFAPWAVHVIANIDWLGGVISNVGLPGPWWKKIFALQGFNLITVGCALWAFRRLWKGNVCHQIPKYMLIGFLPFLFSYGGRYFMHTAPVWAMLAAVVLVRFLPVAARARRIAVVIAALTLAPTPNFFFAGKAAPLPLTATHLLLITSLTHGGGIFSDEKTGERYGADCDEVAAWLREHTSVDDVIHTNKEWVADMIALLADRRTDFGAWWECSKAEATRRNREWWDAQAESVFVCIRPRADSGSILGPTQAMPGADEFIEKGRMLVGVRRRHRFASEPLAEDDLATGTHGWQGDPPASATWEPGVGVKWRPRAGRLRKTTDKFAGDAVDIRLRTNRPLDEVAVRFRQRDGRAFEWPLTVSDNDVWREKRVILDWLTPPTAGERPEERLVPGEVVEIALEAREPWRLPDDTVVTIQRIRVFAEDGESRD